MKIRKNGFSVVEIMVSMVILSIVMLVMTNVIAVSSKQHKAAQQNDDGEYVARKKLSELLHPSATIPTASTSDQTVPYKNINYTVSWKVSTTSPILVTVKAEWTGNGRLDSAVVAGYLEASNSCAEITTQTKPSFKLFTAQTPSVEITNGIVPLGHGTPPNRAVCILKGIDPDIEKGDLLTFTLPTGQNNDLFSISGDTLKTKVPFNVASQSYTVKVQVKDCRNNSDGTFDSTFTVAVGATNDKPKAVSPQSFTANENQKAVGTLVYDAGQTGLTWTSVSNSAFSVTAAGVITANSDLNFESNPSYTFDANLRSNTNNDSTIKVILTVTDVNEKPTTVTFTPAKTTLTTADAGANAILGSLTAQDLDLSPTNAGWKTHRFELISSGDHLKFSISNTSLKVGSTALASGTYSIQVKPTDLGSLSADAATTISVVIGSVGVDCSTAPFANVSGGTYAANVKLTYKGKRIKLGPIGGWYSYAQLASSPWVDEGDCAARDCSTINLFTTDVGENSIVKSNDGKIYKSLKWTNASTPLTTTTNWEYNGVCQ